MPFLQVPHDYKERQVLVNGEEESLLHKALVHFSLKGYVHNDIWWRHIGIISVKTPVQHNHNLRAFSPKEQESGGTNANKAHRRSCCSL
jgi:hypothetical protein